MNDIKVGNGVTVCFGIVETDIGSDKFKAFAEFHKPCNGHPHEGCTVIKTRESPHELDEGDATKEAVYAAHLIGEELKLHMSFYNN